MEAEEYLEAIYKLEEKYGVAKTLELAKQLGVSPGSVTNTVEGLERRCLLTRKPYKGVRLTEEGRRIALAVIRRHRLLERLLTDILRMDWSRVHEEACRLEHSLSEEVLTLLERALNYPSTCPHGNPIPTERGEIRDFKPSELLSNLKPGDKAIIVNITDERREILEFFGRIGFTPGSRLELLEKGVNGLRVRVGGGEIFITPQLVSTLRVRRVEA